MHIFFLELWMTGCYGLCAPLFATANCLWLRMGTPPKPRLPLLLLLLLVSVSARARLRGQHRSRSTFFPLVSYLEAILNADIIIQTTVWVGSFRSNVSCSWAVFPPHLFILLLWQVLICSHSVMAASPSLSLSLSCTPSAVAPPLDSGYGSLQISVYSIMFEHILHMHLALDNSQQDRSYSHSFTDFRFAFIVLLSQIHGICTVH